MGISNCRQSQHTWSSVSALDYSVITVNASGLIHRSNEVLKSASVQSRFFRCVYFWRASEIWLTVKVTPGLMPSIHGGHEKLPCEQKHPEGCCDAWRLWGHLGLACGTRVCYSVKILFISLIDFALCARQTVTYIYLLELLNLLLYNIY